MQPSACWHDRVTAETDSVYTLITFMCKIQFNIRLNLFLSTWLGSFPSGFLCTYLSLPPFVLHAHPYQSPLSDSS